MITENVAPITPSQLHSMDGRESNGGLIGVILIMTTKVYLCSILVTLLNVMQFTL